MFISKETHDALDSMDTLPSVRLADVNPDIHEVLRKENLFVKSACLRIIAYVMAVDGVCASAVTVQRLVEHDVLDAVIKFSRTLSYLKGGFRRFLLDIGHLGAAERLIGAPPLLLEWLDSKTIEDTRKVIIRCQCLQFLKWLCNEQFPMYRPEDIPLQFLVREYLVRYRRHFIQDAKHRGIKPESQKRHMQFITAWVRWMCDTGKIAHIDTDGLAIRKSKNRPRHLPSHSQLSLLFRDLFQHTSELYVIAFLLMLCTGARPIEIIRLTFNQLDMVNQRLYLQSKGGPGRWIPISKNVWEALERYVRSRHKDSISTENRIFVRPNGRYLTYPTLIRRIARKRCVEIDGILALRHRFATDCYKSKMPPRVFQYVMGHKGLSEMSRYQHEDTTFLYEEIRGALDDGGVLV